MSFYENCSNGNHTHSNSDRIKKDDFITFKRMISPSNKFVFMVALNSLKSYDLKLAYLKIVSCSIKD